MFNVGDKIIRNRNAWADDRIHKKGIVGFIKPNGHFRLVDEKEDADRIPQYWSLVEPVAQHPTPFVFIQEGMDYIKVGSGDYVSLEDAHKRCLELRRLYKSDKIYSYVKVEE